MIYSSHNILNVLWYTQYSTQFRSMRHLADKEFLEWMQSSRPLQDTSTIHNHNRWFIKIHSFCQQNSKLQLYLDTTNPWCQIEICELRPDKVNQVNQVNHPNVTICYHDESIPHHPRSTIFTHWVSTAFRLSWTPSRFKGSIKGAW